MESEIEERFEREVLSFLAILEKLGGLVEIIALFSAFFVLPFNKFLFESHLIENLYIY